MEFDLNICFQASQLAVHSLELFVAVYPLVLMMITYKVTCMHDNNNKVIVALLRPFKAACKCFKYKWTLKLLQLIHLQCLCFFPTSNLLMFVLICCCL